METSKANKNYVASVTITNWKADEKYWNKRL